MYRQNKRVEAHFPLTSRKSARHAEICERRKTYRPLIALIDESTGDRPGVDSPVFISISTPWWLSPFSRPDGERSCSLSLSLSSRHPNIFLLFLAAL